MLAGKPKKEEPLRRPGLRWEGAKMNLQGVGYKDVNENLPAGCKAQSGGSYDQGNVL
jgi:hypothetical protein